MCKRCTQHGTAEQPTAASIVTPPTGPCSQSLECVRMSRGCASDSLVAAGQGVAMCSARGDLVMNTGNVPFCLTTTTLPTAQTQFTLRGCKGRHSCSIHGHKHPVSFPVATAGVYLTRWHPFAGLAPSYCDPRLFANVHCTSSCGRLGRVAVDLEETSVGR